MYARVWTISKLIICGEAWQMFKQVGKNATFQTWILYNLLYGNKKRAKYLVFSFDMYRMKISEKRRCHESPRCKIYAYISGVLVLWNFVNEYCGCKCEKKFIYKLTSFEYLLKSCKRKLVLLLTFHFEIFIRDFVVYRGKKLNL